MATPVPGKLGKMADSFGGIVEALKQVRLKNGLGYRAYEYSFHGIIEAIKDLAVLGNGGDGELPPGWEVETDQDGNIIGGDWQYPPSNGQLWFDERQGRLFIYVDDGFYQTNGNDGLAYVGETPPSEEVIGGSWYNPVTKGLYIWDGTAWQLIDMAGTLTTEDMRLNSVTEAFSSALSGHLVSPYSVPLGAAPTQGSYNRWVARSLVELEAEAKVLKDEPTVSAQHHCPDNPQEGDLWFDTSELNLYCYYVDNDAGQWVPSVSTFKDNSEFNALETSIDNLSSSTNQQCLALGQRIDNLPLATLAVKAEVNAAQSTLSDSITALQTLVGDLNRFASASSVATSVSDLNARIDAVEASEPDISGLATSAELNNSVNTLTAEITSGDTACMTYVDQKAAEVTAMIPDVSHKANQTELHAFITNAAQLYFPRQGGTLNGTFGMQKNDIALPSFDFSNAHYYGNKVFKFKTNSTTDQYVEFGTNAQPWEYSWDFNANEDFCWNHGDAGKVFSISEDGPACETLTIGEFLTNNSAGRRITQPIEVGERLRTYQSALEAVRSAATLATDFDSFKIRLLEALAPV